VDRVRARKTPGRCGSILGLFLFGSILLLICAIHTQDPVFIAGQGRGPVICLRNLRLIFNERKAAMASTD